MGIRTHERGVHNTWVQGREGGPRVKESSPKISWGLTFSNLTRPHEKKLPGVHHPSAQGQKGGQAEILWELRKCLQNCVKTSIDTLGKPTLFYIL